MHVYLNTRARPGFLDDTCILKYLRIGSTRFHIAKFFRYVTLQKYLPV